MYGNYCGVYWSDGKFQSSVADGASIPVDALDKACRSHDTVFAKKGDIRAANKEFIDTLVKLGTPRAIAYAFIVKATGFGETRFRQQGKQIEPTKIFSKRMRGDTPWGTVPGYQPEIGPVYQPVGIINPLTGNLPGFAENTTDWRLAGETETSRATQPSSYVNNTNGTDYCAVAEGSSLSTSGGSPSGLPTLGPPNEMTNNNSRQQSRETDRGHKSEQILRFKSYKMPPKQQKQKMQQKQRSAPKPSKPQRRSAPVAVSEMTVTNPPQVQYSSNGSGSVRVVHREYLGELTSVSATIYEVLKTLPLNPGSSVTFPWLSSLANRFEKYRFHRLEFGYSPECSTSTNGVVMSLIDYDPSDSAPGDKGVLLNAVGASKMAPWSFHSCKFIPKLAGPFPKFIRPYGNVPNDVDVSTYDCGNYYCAVTGVPAVTVLGDLWVQYDVELMGPQISTLTSGLTIYGTLGVSASVPWGTQRTMSGGVEGVSVNTAGTIMTFAKMGTFMSVSYATTSSSPTATDTSGSTVTFLDKFQSVDTATRSVLTMLISVTAVGQTLTFVAYAEQACTAIRWFIFPVDSAITSLD